MVIFEVLSPGTENYDRGEKREHCQQIESLREYVLLSQDAQKVELWSRASTAEAWAYTSHGPGDTVELRSIGCLLAVNGIYAAAGITAI